MLVYETEKFKRQAAKLGMQAKVQDLRRLVEGAADVAEVRQYFDALVPYYKDRSGKVRIIGGMHKVADHDVFCFLGALERKSDTYRDFLWDRRKFGATHLEVDLDLDELAEWVEAEMARPGVVDSTADPLPENMWGWLEAPREAVAGLAADQDVQIYESRRWVDEIAGRKFQQALIRYYDLVQKAAVEPDSGQVVKGLERVEVVSSGGNSILIRRFDAGPGQAKSLFLVAPFFGRPQADQLHEAVAACQMGSKMGFDLEDIARRSRRTYPSYLLADEEAWRSIESDVAANLALSGEEEQLLLSVAGSTEESGLPLFINGRAGSGKSTMLAYLFAAFCIRRQRGNLPGRPLFLTYNDRLLKTSLAAVNSLLTASHDVIAQQAEFDGTETANWFSSFRDYLISRLPENQRANYPVDRHVAFHHFRNAYLGESGRLPALQLAERRKWSAEIAWYVIRTFIKGYAASGYLTPEDYSEIPRAERVVDEETYEAIYNSIWERWYQRAIEDSEAWDDQDLVLAVLREGGSDPADPVMAIVCDEAQDFTRRELQLVIRSLHMTEYDITKQPIHSLPLVLAGDPLQTLNPTGFRWEAVQAALHEELAIKLGEGRVSVRLDQLENNYRSTAPIVEAVNGIQLWRSVLFDIREVRPQMSWDVSEGSKPHKYIIGSNITIDELTRLVEDTIIIVPCDEGGEADFVRSDEVLSRIFPEVSDANPARNVLSATSAKGCEFGRVIVWCFGDACPDGLFTDVTDGATLPRSRFKGEHFLNKLYVAASRAKQHLFVVDTLSGDARLWSHHQAEALARFVADAQDPTRWEELCRPIELAPVGASSELQETAIEETAIVLREQGLSARHPQLLRQAADFFRSVPNEDEASRCEAWARRFEEQLVPAGQLFAQIGDRREAFDCFWEARSWLDLRDWYQRLPAGQIVNDDRRGVVEFMIGGRSADDVVRFAQNLGSLMDQQRLGSFLDPGWRDGIAAFLKVVSDLLPAIRPDDITSVAEVLAELGDRGYRDALKVAGAAFHRGNELERAVACWERADHVRHADYALAKAHVVGLPQGLEWLTRDSGNKGPEKVLELWRERGNPSDPGWLRHVAPAHERLGGAQEAFEIYRALGDLHGQVRLYPKVPAGPARKSLEPLSLALMETGDLETVVDLLDRGRRFDRERARAAQVAVKTLVRSAFESGWTSISTKLERDQVKRLVTMARVGNWRRSVNPLVMGAALELAGNYVDALAFYEGFTDDSDSALRSASRRRWLKVKADQLAQASPGGKSADMTRRERARRAHDWGIREDVALEDNPPLPDGVFDIVQPQKSQETWEDKVSGVELQRREGALLVLDFATTQMVQVDPSTGQATTASGEIDAISGVVTITLAPDRVVEVDIGARTITVTDGGTRTERSLD